MEKTLRCFKLKGFFNGFFDALFNLLSRVAVAEFVICDWECLLLFVETHRQLAMFVLELKLKRLFSALENTQRTCWFESCAEGDCNKVSSLFFPMSKTVGCGLGCVLVKKLNIFQTFFNC